jgi:hypothetical protein
MGMNIPSVAYPLPNGCPLLGVEDYMDSDFPPGHFHSPTTSLQTESVAYSSAVRFNDQHGTEPLDMEELPNVASISLQDSATANQSRTLAAPGMIDLQDARMTSITPSPVSFLTLQQRINLT